MRKLAALVALALAVLLLVAACGGGQPAGPQTEIGPRIGDHWHAQYEIFICGVQQPVIPFFPAGVHTHGDGIIHIHPHLPAEEGLGARLVKFFDYAGGKLSTNTLQMPGDEKEWKNGDLCPVGQPGQVQMYVNDVRLRDVEGYVPQDGDTIRIDFGP